MESKSIDVSKLIDEQKLSTFTIMLVFLSFLVMLTDGYDLLATSYGAPGLRDAWHLKPADLGFIFSASPVGMILGAPILGWLGDRYGRKVTIIFGAALYGLFSIFSAMSSTTQELMILRFVTGIGLGGMMPSITALNAEFAPQRMRATLVVIMFAGVTAGSALPAAVLWALPKVGWQELYWIGGVVPLILAVVLWFWLPESVKFLALKQTPRARAALEQTVRRVRLDLAVDANTVFFSSEQKRAGVPVAELFQDGLHYITPLLWVLFVTNLTANYFLYNWMPILFRSAGLSGGAANLTTAFYYIGGVVGGLTVSRFIDKKGLLPVAIFFTMGVVCVACIGLPGLKQWAATSMVFLGGFCVLGVQLGINAASGLIYPTRMRATGAGWAFGIGRLGGFFGPQLGAVLIGMKLSTFQLFLAPAVPLALGAIACFVLVKLCRIRFGGDQLGDAARSVGPTESGADAAQAGLTRA